MDINLVFDAAAEAAPASFRATLQTAATLLASAFTDNVTINIDIEYGEDGIASTSAESGPADGVFEPYQTIRNDLVNDATPGDATFADLPNTSTIQGQSEIAVWPAQEKILGLLPATDTAIDGTSDFGTAIPQANLLGVAMHELAHAMGRVPYGPQPDIFDLFRFTAPGTYLFNGNVPAPAEAYFSLNGGASAIADYGVNSDPSDFLNNYGSPSSTLSPEDPFNELYDSGTLQHLTALDLQQMDALGFHIAPGFLKTSGDFSGNGLTDLLWVNGAVFTEWQGNLGNTLTPNVYVGGVAAGWQLVGIGDFNGDGKSDLIWQNGTTFTEWQSTGNGFTPNVYVGNVSPGTTLAGIGDFTGNGMSDLIWQTGQNFSEWQSTGSSFTQNAVTFGVSAGWSLAGIGDFTGDGMSDLIWQNGTTFTEWQSTGNSFTPNVTVFSVSPGWSLTGVGDFNGNGMDDLLWENGTTFTEWQSTGNGFTPNVYVGSTPAGWSVAAIGDFNGDGMSDILFRNTSTGAFSEWQSTGSGFTENVLVNSTVATAWTLEYSPTGALGSSADPAQAQPSAPSATAPAAPAPAAPVSATASPTVGGSASASSYAAADGSTPIGAGDTQTVSAGSTILNPVISGGALDLLAGALVDGPISFGAVSGGTLLDADTAALPDTVVGFSEGTDHLSFAGETAGSEAAVIASAQLVNGSTVLSFPDHTSIVLAGVTHVDTGIFA